MDYANLEVTDDNESIVVEQGEDHERMQREAVITPHMPQNHVESTRFGLAAFFDPCICSVFWL